jgi:hypothetical protein
LTQVKPCRRTTSRDGTFAADSGFAIKSSALKGIGIRSEIGQSAELHTVSDGRAFQDSLNFDDPGSIRHSGVPNQLRLKGNRHD